MASVGSIFLELGLKTAGFNKDVSKAEANIKKTSQNLAKGADQVASKALGQIAGIARMVAAPLAGAISIGSMIKSYFGGVAQVAQMTGQYSTKLEEWRKKRALLNRVTQEDIQLYKKSREALVKFQITMADLSSKIMRNASPAVKMFVDWLNKLSDWIDKYSDDIVRFLRVVAGIITVALLPALSRMAAALLMNPITWIIAALAGLALAIDDLIVYLKGGDSALDSFWKMLGLTKGDTKLLGQAMDFLKQNLIKLVAGFVGLSVGIKVLSTLQSAIQNVVLYSAGFAKVVGVFGTLAKIIGTCTFAMIKFTIACLSNPIVLIIMAIVAAIALVSFGIYELWKHWDEVTEWIGEKCDAICAWLTEIGTAIGQWFIAKIEATKAAWDVFCNILKEWIDKIVAWFADIGAAIKQWFNDKVDAAKTSWVNFCNSIKSWIDKVINWFADIGRAIKEAFSMDNIMKKVNAVLKKLNPANWFSSDDSAEEAKEGAAGGKKEPGFFDKLFRRNNNLEDVNSMAAAGESAEMANASVHNGDRTVNNNQQINMYQPTAGAVDRAFESAGMGNSSYADMVDQNAAGAM